MDLIVVLLLGFAAFLRFRVARRIAATPLAGSRQGRIIIAYQRILGIAFILAALAWAWWRR